MRLRRDFGFRSVSAESPRATCSKITFECSILYRLLIVNGCTLLAIEPLSQGDRAFNSTYLPEPHPGVRCPRSRNMSGERSPMQLSPILHEESVTRLLQGAFVGFAATAIIGFTWGGKNRQGNGGEKRCHPRRGRTCSHLRP